MWQDLIKYRNNLNIDKNVTFGTEIEFTNARRSYIEDELNLAYENKMINKPWHLENEETIYDGNTIFSSKGGEAISDVLTDNEDTWKNIKLACDTIKKYYGQISKKCGAHVHIGANIFSDNLKYYSRLAKLYTTFEDILIRFYYGELSSPRERLYYYAASNTSIFKYIDLFYKNDKPIKSFDEFVLTYSGSKNLAISFRRLDKNYVQRKYGKDIKNWEDYRTLEFRLGMGTLNESIWQNYINLDTKLMLCCLDDSKDWDYIDKLFHIAISNEHIEEFNDEYNLEKAIIFSNFIFDNNIDKLYFLRQYIKSDIRIDKNELIRKK